MRAIKVGDYVRRDKVLPVDARVCLGRVLRIHQGYCDTTSGYRCALKWLARIPSWANERGLPVRVMHYPPRKNSS